MAKGFDKFNKYIVLPEAIQAQSQVQEEVSEVTPDKKITRGMFGKGARLFAPAGYESGKKLLTKGISKVLGPEKAQAYQRMQTGAEELTGRGFTQAINVAGFNVPKIAARKAGLDILPKAETTGEKVADVVGGVVGSVVGPGTAFKAVRGLKGLGAAPELVKDVVAGAVTGGAYTPETGFGDLKARGTQALVGGGVSGAMGVGYRGLRDLSRIISAGKQKNLLKTLRETIIGADRQASKRFGQEIARLQKEHPSGLVDIESAVDDTIQVKITPRNLSNIKLRNAINRSKTLQTIARKTDVQSRSFIDLRKSQDIINELEDTLPQRVFRGDVSTDEREIISLIENIRKAQDVIYPEMEGVRAQFRAIREPFNQIKNFTKKGEMGAAVTSGKGQIGTHGGPFGKDVEFIAEELPKLLPRHLIKELGGLRSAVNIVLALGKIGGAGATIALATEPLRRTVRGLLGVGGGGGEGGGNY